MISPFRSGSASAYLSFIVGNSRVLAFGYLLMLFSSMGQTFMIALSGGAIREALNLTSGSFGSIYSAATLCSALCLPWVGRLIDRIDIRYYTVMVSLGLAASCLLMSSAHHVAMLALALFGLRLCGQGLMTHTAMTGLARNTGSARGKALGFGSLGLSTAEALLPSIVILALGAFGWRAVWLAFAVILLAVVPTAALRLMRTRSRSEDRSAPTDHPTDHPAAPGLHPWEDRTARVWTTREILRDPRFLAVLPALVAPGFINTAVFFHQVALVSAKGWALSWFATGFTAYAVTTVTTLLLAGPMIDRVGTLRVMPLFLLPLAAGLLLLAAGQTPVLVIPFMICVGLTNGITNIVSTAVWVELYGMASLGTTRSLASSVLVFSTALSPALFGVLLDLGVGFGALLSGCAIGAMIASALCLLPLRYSRQSSAQYMKLDGKL
jgi:MFS family permease